MPHKLSFKSLMASAEKLVRARSSQLSIVSFRYFLKLFLFAFAYFAAGRIGLLLATLNQTASPVWPATGFAFGMILAFGFRYWPAIALGAFLTNYFTNVSVGTVLAITFGNTAEALLGAWAIQRISANGTLGLYARAIGVVAGTLPAAAVSATIGSLSLVVSGGISASGFIEVWKTWWVGDTLGGFMITPLILECADARRFICPHKLNSFVIMVVGIVMSWLIFWTPEGGLYLFLLFPYLYIAVSILDRRLFSVTALTISCLSLWSTHAGKGVFHVGSTNTNLIHLQIFLASLSFTTLILLEFKEIGLLRRLRYVLFSGWTLSAILFVSFYSRGQYEVELQFKKVIAVAHERLLAQTHHYVVALRSGAGLFASSKSVERSEWRSFVEQLGSLNERGGLRGLGVIFRIPKRQLNEFVRLTRMDQSPAFTYHGVPSGSEKIDEAYLITFIEPVVKNSQAVGLDVATEYRRRVAAEKSIDSGEPTFTQTITLVQDTKKGAGFLVYLPFYTHGLVPATAEERRSRHLGWIYAPIVAEDFFEAALGQSFIPELSYSISASDGEVITRSSDFPDRSSQMEKQEEIQIAGQTFRFTARPSTAFKTDVDTMSSWMGAAGALLTLLLGALFATMHSTNLRVNALVDKKTKELELTGQMAHVGGWEADLGTQRVLWSKVTKAIHEVEDEFNPDLMTSLNFYKEGESRTSIVSAIKMAMSKGTPWDLELVMITAKGREIWVRNIGRPQMEETKVVRLFGALQDITDRKMKELLFINTAKMASLGEMAGGVAHEVNNPLTIILGKIDKLKALLSASEIDKEFFAREISKVSETAHRIGKIIKGLRVYSRDADADPFLDIELSTLLNDTLSLCRERFRVHGVELRVGKIPVGTIQVRSTQISQILVNLLNNAFDAVQSLPNPWIELNVAFIDGEGVQFTVTDCGSGIPKELADKIMQPFFSTKEVGKGAGLGLPVSESMAKDHGGDLVLDRENVHTKFVLTLPIRQTLPNKKNVLVA